MARRRVRAAVRKSRESEARLIGSGVYSVALDLEGRTDLPLPVYASAPLIYVSEMLASVLCKREGWTAEARKDQVARYLMAGLQEYAVALFGDFKVAHFEEWIAAAEAREAAEG